MTCPHDFEAQPWIDEMPSPTFRCKVDGATATGIYRPRHDDVLVQVDGEEQIQILLPAQVRSLIDEPLCFNTRGHRGLCSDTTPAATPACCCNQSGAST